MAVAEGEFTMAYEVAAPLAGGVVIGLASALLFSLNGRIFGVSGILGGLLAPKRGEIAWRAALIAGLVLGGVVLRRALPSAFDISAARPIGFTLIAGLLVGFGTRLGSGCTSGHGVCGVARLSPRSLVATLTFVGVGMISATLVHLIAGGQ
jgi:uncharacterized protein